MPKNKSQKCLDRLCDYITSLADAESAVQIAKEILVSNVNTSEKKLFDHLKGGESTQKINVKQLQEFFKKNRILVDKDIIRELFYSVDKNSNLSIDFPEFCKFIQPTRKSDKSFYQKQLKLDADQVLTRLFESEINCLKSLFNSNKRKGLPAFLVNFEDFFIRLDQGCKGFLGEEDIYNVIERCGRSLSKEMANGAISRMLEDIDESFGFEQWESICERLNIFFDKDKAIQSCGSFEEVEIKLEDYGVRSGIREETGGRNKDDLVEKPVKAQK